MSRSRLFLSAVTLITVVFSCKKDSSPEPIDFGFEYIPLELGSVLEYEVDSIVYDEFDASIDTFSFILKEECVEVFQDITGRDVYRFERYKLFPDSVGFKFAGTYGLVLEDLRLERIEENVKTIPLIFPPSIDLEWDGNAFNSRAELEYVYQEVDVPRTIGALSFDRSLKVIQENDSNNFVIKRYSEEEYARNTGLISKTFFHIETQFGIDSGLLWRQRISAVPAVE